MNYQTSFISQFGTGGFGPNEYNTPEHIAVGGDGNVYVGDASNNRIQVLDKDGTFITTIGSYGTGPVEFDYAIGASYRAGGNLFVADYGNHRVQILDPVTYAYIGEIDGTTGAGAFNVIPFVYVAPDLNVYVADQGNGRVQVFDQSGAFVGAFASPGINSLTVAPDGRIYTSDGSNVSIFDSSFTYLGNLSSPGDIITSFGMNADSSGNVYVTDYSGNKIVVYDRNGNLVLNITDIGAPSGSLITPEGIFANSDGRVYSTEYNTNRINIFQMLSTETFTTSPAGGDETAMTPLADLVLNGAGSFADDFIGYRDLAMTGNWVLGGTNTFSGDAVLNSGAITNNGSFTADSLTLPTGSRLMGNGTFNLDVTHPGILSPGSTGDSNIGTLTINGSFTALPTSVYNLNLNAAGQADRLTVSNTAVIDGALVITAASGNYAPSTSYTILSAVSGITGTFSSVTDNFAFLDTAVDYTNPNVITLTMTRNGIAPPGSGIDFTPFASNANQQAAADALSEYSDSQFGGDTTAFNTALALNTADTALLLSEMSPDSVASAPQIQGTMLRTLQSPIFSRFDAVSDGASGGQEFDLIEPSASSDFNRKRFWVQALQGIASQDNGRNGASGYNLDMSGMRAGIDVEHENTLMGFSGAYLYGSADFKNSADKSKAQYGHADIYGRYTDADSGVVLQGIAGAGAGRVENTRIISAGLFNLAAEGVTEAYDISTAVKASKPLKISATDKVIPNITATAAWQYRDGFTETGAAPFNLNINSASNLPITISPMVNWQRDIQKPEYGFTVLPDIGVGATWQVTGNDDSSFASFANNSAIGFGTQGAKQAPISLNLNAAISLQPSTGGLTPEITAQALSQFSHDGSAVTGSVAAKWEW